MGISSGRIIDNAGNRALAIGVESFEMVVDNYVYVDKSLLARELERRPGGTILFCRPRRFGKSLAMRMLKCYFEAPVPYAREPIPDRTRLFEGLAAGEGDDPHRGAHPVIFLSLGGVKGATWEEARGRIAGYVAGECKRHDYLLDDPAVANADKAMLRRLMDKRPEGDDLAASLALLSRVLHRHHGARTVILIDEYDTPVVQGHLSGFRDQACGFYRMWLTDALKATESLYLGVLTGVQRVSRESIFSDLNNVTVDTALSHRFSEAFGFTDAEAVELAGYLGLSDRVPEMRDWYDGYRFGDESVYNPWSLLNYLAEGGVAQPYWGNASSNDIVHDLFSQAEGATAGELAALASGGAVEESVNLATVFDMIGKDPQAIWGQLYLAGYLTTDDVEAPNDAYMPRGLRVPNREVRALYREEFYGRSLLLAGDGPRLRSLHKALRAGDAPALESALRRVLLDSPAALDLVRENSYHMLLLGLLYDVYGYRFPRSNREAGDGFADIVLVPERENVGKLPGIVVEVKWLDRKAKQPAAAAEPNAAGAGSAADPDDPDAAGTAADTDDPPAALARLAAKALEQARARTYDDVLPAGPRLTWGVAFAGKHAAATCERP